VHVGVPNLPEIVLDVAQLSKAYRSRTGPVPAVQEITFSVGTGEFVSIVGPSGCGKTTLMMCLAGLNPITSGRITFRGQPVTGPPLGLAVVFQDYSRSLFPWLTVEANVALPLRDRGLLNAQVRETVLRALDMVGLRPAAKLHPWELSGGMQQRVAIARGLAMAPDVLIMDEPFASVDAQTRANLEDLLLDVWVQLKTTVLFVTHDIDEAVYLSDRIIVLSQGPSVVRAEIGVPLPRPRDQLSTKELPLFSQIRHDVYTLVMEAQRRTSIIGEEPA
jgi:NitT/TauT family transport system ATP-binding protein